MMAYLGKGKVKDMYISAKPELFRLAHNMRHNPTKAEQILWNELRKFRSNGYIFRRQHPIDFYIADFYCQIVKLVIEVDGGHHLNDKNIEYDDSRSGELERYGLEVIRFNNDEVLNNIESVLFAIQQKIGDLASPAPPGRGGREGVRP